MKKRIIIVLITTAVLLTGVIASTSNNQSSNINSVKPNNSTSTTQKTTEKVEPICDGTTVTTGCTLDGISYKTYIYHPAIAEKTHTETVTTYQKEVTGYCTLCSDGTYSPSCATGRGACSYHGGVAQWNAPEYGSVPVYSTKTIVDAPAQEAYYEKVTN
jgi:hypothetical protein